MIRLTEPQIGALRLSAGLRYRPHVHARSYARPTALGLIGQDGHVTAAGIAHLRDAGELVPDRCDDLARVDELLARIA